MATAHRRRSEATSDEVTSDPVPPAAPATQPTTRLRPAPHNQEVLSRLSRSLSRSHTRGVGGVGGARSRPNQQPQTAGAMPLMAHLRELRSRILKSLFAIVIGAVVGWIYYVPIFDFIVAPLKDVADDLAEQGLTVELTLDLGDLTVHAATPHIALDRRHPRLTSLDLPDLGVHHAGPA